MSQVTEAEIEEQVLFFLRNNQHRGYRAKELASRFQYKSNDVYRRYRTVMTSLEEEGKIRRIKKGLYTFGNPETDLVRGTVQVKPTGFGFLKQEDSDQEVFISKRNLQNALDGDLVDVVIVKPAIEEDLPEGRVQTIIKRGRERTVGTLTSTQMGGYVHSDDPSLPLAVFIDAEDMNGATDGDKVVISIDAFEDYMDFPSGTVTEVIGRADDPEVVLTAIARSRDIRIEFPQEVLDELSSIPTEITPDMFGERLDLREESIFTIDPLDAKDFDDAIHIKNTPEGYEVGVHIADVSHFVVPGSAIDKEGLERATSTYMVDRVIPMLPEKLSNGICSLKPNEVRFAYSCIMQLNRSLDVVDFAVVETVIKSQARLTYEQAQRVIEGHDKDNPLKDDILLAAKVARQLTQQRQQQGAIGFETPEVHVILDREKNPVDIRQKTRLDAHKLIEEYMLLANMTVARHGHQSVGAAGKYVFRVHAPPDHERLKSLNRYLGIFGFELNVTGEVAKPSDISRLLNEVKGSPIETIVNQEVLRSMSKAIYTTTFGGHFGLAAESYTHFTSPIRRYPDLLVHRLLKAVEAGASLPHQTQLDEMTEHCSERERAAEEAERDSVRMMQAAYLQKYVGEMYEGLITSVTHFGAFVRLDEVFAEGLVHVRDMKSDHFDYDRDNFVLRGRKSGRVLRPGLRVRVIIANADPETRKVDFVFDPNQKLPKS